MNQLRKIWDGIFAADDPKYRTASPISMMFCSAGSGAKMAVMILMILSSYAANLGFGIVATVAGVIMTVKGFFDGGIDPVIAGIYDRMPVGKHGKMRIFLLTGFAICVVSSVLMFFVLPEKISGVPALVVFIILYFMFAIGYSTLGIAVTTVPAMLTNNPKQRPFMNFMAQVYQYITPIIITNIVSFKVLPKYDNQYNVASMKELVWVYLGIAAVFLVLACIGMSQVDKPEILGALVTNGGTKEEKIKVKDMWNFVRHNKAMRCYLVTGISDKIGTSTAGQSVITTLIGGVLIGSYQATTVINSVSSILGLVFAFFGGVLIARWGAKKAVNISAAGSIIVAAITAIFFFVMKPSGMPALGVMGAPMIFYMVLILGRQVFMVMNGTAEGMMRADVVDYELERSGNYMPGMVGAVYTFTDQIVCSFNSTIAAFAITLIGYGKTLPQMGDKATWSVMIVAVAITYGLPALGWIFNIVAMKYYELDKKRMEEVQQNIYDRKMAAIAAAGK